MNNSNNWVGAWMASLQLTEPGNLPPPPGFVDTTVRQLVRLTLAGRKLRVRLFNEFGTALRDPQNRTQLSHAAYLHP